MDWQSIIVYAIGAAVLLWLARAVVRIIRTRKYSKCGSCSDAACPYHMQKKKGGCR